MLGFEKYFTDIADGKIVSCEKMKQAADMLLARFYNPDEYILIPRLPKGIQILWKNSARYLPESLELH